MVSDPPNDPEFDNYWSSDSMVDRVMERVYRRSEAGLKKYGVTMLRDDVSTIEWLRHAQEEALDFAVYIERVIHDLELKKNA